MQYNQYNNQQYGQYNQQPQYVTGSLVSNVMKRVYLTMTLGLLITAFTSLFCASSYSVISFFVQNIGTTFTSTKATVIITTTSVETALILGFTRLLMV